MSYHIDFHCHTFFSADGSSRPEALVEVAGRKGLHGFAVTDHDCGEAIGYLRDRGLLRADGQAVNGLLIIPGMEITTADGHLLCLGATLPRSWKGRPAREVCAAIHDAGGIAVPPHPYDLFRAGIRRAVLDQLPVDAIETFNAASTLRRYNRHAADYAATRGLPATAASDSHHETTLGTAYTVVDAAELSVAAVLEAVKRGRTGLHQRYLQPKDTLRKTWNNWLRLKKRRPHPAAEASAAGA